MTATDPKRRASLRRRQVRLLAVRRADVADDAGARMDAAIHFNGWCGESDCGPQPEPDPATREDGDVDF